MKKISCLLAAVLLMISLSACSQSGKSNYRDLAESDAAPAASAEAASGSVGEIEELSRKLIYHADISAETKEFDQTKASLDSLIAECQGYVESSDLSGGANGEDRRLSYRIRVPAASLDEFLGRLEGIMNVISTTKDMEDVTGSYIDTEARLNSLEKEEARLLEMLDQAETLDEILQLEDRLSQVRYEIESLTAQINTYDNEIEYSVVNLYLRDVTEFSANSSFGSRSWEAFTGGWSSFVSVAQDLVISVIWALPFLLVIAAAVVIAVICAKRSSKKKRARFAAKFEQPGDTPPKGPTAP